MLSEGITLEAPAWTSPGERDTRLSCATRGAAASDQNSTVRLLTPQTPESLWIPTAAKCHWQMGGSQGRQAETHCPQQLPLHLLKSQGAVSSLSC